MAVRQSNLPVLYSYCTQSVRIDVHGEFELINAQLFDVFPAISSRKVGGKFVFILSREL